MMPSMLCRGPRSGVVHTALSFALTALLLAWLAGHALYGPYGGSERRTFVAMAAIILALAGFAIAIRVVMRALRRYSLLRAQMRPGEQIAGVFRAELATVGDGCRVEGVEPVGITLTNQRLLLHRPESVPEPAIEFEQEEIVALDRGRPTSCPGLRRCILQTLKLEHGRKVFLRMSAGTAIDFIGPRDQYLRPKKREMRALVVAARGPTPSRPDKPLDAILNDGQPTVCLLELAENYLRVVGEHSPPLADLYHYFHWEHMSAGAFEPAELDGLPKSWKRLTLYFHEDASMTLCGTHRAMEKLRATALSRGAAEAAATSAR
jgi:hypothetical protein